MLIKEGQIWQGFIEPFSTLKCIEVLEVKTDSDGFSIIGFTDNEYDIYFMPDYLFEKKFEFKV